MNSKVGVQGAASIECLSTILAFVRLLLRMNDFVAAQRARLPKSFAAHLGEYFDAYHDCTIQ